MAGEGTLPTAAAAPFFELQATAFGRVLLGIVGAVPDYAWPESEPGKVGPVQGRLKLYKLLAKTEVMWQTVEFHDEAVKSGHG